MVFGWQQLGMTTVIMIWLVFSFLLAELKSQYDQLAFNSGRCGICCVIRSFLLRSPDCCKGLFSVKSDLECFTGHSVWQHSVRPGRNDSPWFYAGLPLATLWQTKLSHFQETVQ